MMADRKLVLPIAHSAYARGQLIPGTVYRAVRVLGEGGMGRVYEVEDVTIGKRYALKTVVDTRGDVREVSERLLRESRTLAQFTDPRIVNVITAGVASDGQCFYVMEFLEGEPLSAILRRGRRLDLRAIIDVGIDVGQALQVAHAAGVVHRDVKPDNIFIALGPHLATSAKLIDFGVAWLHDGTAQDSGTVYGTLKYASPEQLRGEPATPLMDIWSLGCVLLEAIAGRVPFNSSSVLELVTDVLGPMRAPRLSEAAADAPPQVVKLVAWMLEKDPLRRLSRADVAIAELRRVQHRLAVTRSRASIEDNRTAARSTSAGTTAALRAALV